VDRPEIILAPGPTPIPPEVLLAQGSPLVYHRGPGFGSIMRDVTDRLRNLYRTESADVVLMTSSGTGGLESAIQNCFSPGDKVLVPLAGFFADRWKRLAEAYGLTVHTVDYEWGRRIDPGEVAGALREHPAKAVLLTQSETSTGVVQPIEALASAAREAGALVVVDVVSSTPGGSMSPSEGRRRPCPRARGWRSQRSAPALGRPRARPRTRGSTSTGRPTGRTPAFRTRRIRGRPRSA
jgi:aspartate aminotransferase-like enzyme